MADRSISLTLRASVDGFVAGMQKAKKAAGGLGDSTSKAAADSQASARRIEQAAAAVAKAQDRAKDAAGRLKVAEAELARVRDSGNTVTITRAEERLAKAHRDSEAATKGAADAQKAYQRELQSAGAQVETLGEKIERTSQSMEQVGGALMGFGGVLVAGFGLSVKTAADFEKAMSSVKAATRETDENMARLGEAAKKAGADTAFSAEEAAQGIEEMAKAGVSTADILAGGLDGALALAAAGSLGVADAAELAASAMVQFKLDGSQLPHVADLLAAGAGKAQGSVQDLGDALNQSGLVAAQTGLNIEETTGTLAMFANAGLTGSDAGTSFKTMLQRLNPQSKAAATLMDKLGLSAYDANGNFIGMEQYAGKLKDALSGMSEQQRAAALQTLFGSDAIRAASVLYEGGAEGVREWTDKVDDAGYAAETAREKQNNLAGDLEKLGGAFDTVFLKSGSGANQVLREMTQDLEGFVDWVGQLPEGVLQIAGIFTGVAGGAAVLAGAALTVIPKIKETRDAINDLAPAGGKARTALVEVGKAATVAGLAFTALSTIGAVISEDHVQSAESLEQALIRTARAGDDVSNVALDQVFQQWATVGGESRVSVDNMADAVKAIADPTLGQGINENLNFMNGWFNLPDDEVTAMKDRVHELSNSMGTLATSGNTEMAAQGFRQLTDEFAKHGVSAQDVFNQYPGYRDALMGIANDAGYAASEQELLDWALSGVEPAALAAKRASEDAGGAMGGLGEGAQDAAASTESLVDELSQTTGINPEGLSGMGEAMAILADESEEAGDKLEKVIDALFRAGMAHMSVQDAQAAMYEAMDSLNAAVEENGKNLDMSTEAGRANIDALQGVATAGFDAAKAYAEAGQSQGMVRDALMGTYDELVRGYTAMGQSAEAADVLARRMMGIPEGVDIETSMDQQARIIAESTGQAIDAIPGYKGVELAVSDNGTAGSVQSKINAVTGKEEYVFVSDNGSVTQVQQKIQSINGVDRTVYVDDKGTVHGVQADIDALRGVTRDILVTDEGTTGKVQQRINAVDGKTEYILTTDDGTIRNVQQRIDNVDGVERTVYVDDDGTVYRTQREINDVDGKSVTIVAQASTRDAVADIAHAARDRTVRFFAKFFGDSTQKATSYARTAMKDGGVARLPGYSDGGRLPYTGMGTDQILGVTSTGVPIARVDDGEWVINRRSSEKYGPLLDAINRDDPRLAQLPALATGGMLASAALAGIGGRYQWAEPLVQALDAVQSVVGELESWDVRGSGERWVRTMDGAVTGFTGASRMVAAASGQAAATMGQSAAAARAAAALFVEAGETARSSSQRLSAAGTTASEASGRFVGAGARAVQAGQQFEQASQLAAGAAVSMRQAASVITAAANAAAAAKSAAQRAAVAPSTRPAGSAATKAPAPAAPKPRAAAAAPKANTQGAAGLSSSVLQGHDRHTREWAAEVAKDRQARAKQGWNTAPWEYVLGRPGKKDGYYWEEEGRRWMRELQKRYGPILSGGIHEDWSGRVFFKDGRQIYVDSGGAWRWVPKNDPEYSAKAFNGQLLKDFYPRVKLAAGGRLPRTGRGTDRILGMAGDGTPLAWLDDAEWVINQKSSTKYAAVLDALNRDAPSVQHLASHASGRAPAAPGWSSYMPSARPAVQASAPVVQVPSSITVRIGEDQFVGVVERIGDRRLAHHVASLQQPIRQHGG